MNTPALVSRLDNKALPQWSPASPGYIAMQNGHCPEDPNRQGTRFASAVRRYWWVVVLIWALLAIPASLIIYKVVPAKYVASGSVNVAPVNINPVTLSEKTNPFYNEYMRTQADFMKDPAILKRAAENVRMKNFPWFSQLTDQVDYLEQHVDVEPVANTQNIRITMVHKDAVAAQAIVESVMDAYRESSKDRERVIMESSLGILKQLQATTEQSLKSEQAQFEKLTSEDNMNWSDQDRKVFADVLTTGKETLNRLETQQLSLTAQLATLKARPLPDEATYRSSIQTDNDPQIGQWMTERIRVQMADNVLASKHATEQHPDRVEYRRQLKTLDSKIAGRRKEIQDNAWATYKAGFDLEKANKTRDTQADLDALDQQIAVLKKRIDDSDAIASSIRNKTQPINTLREQISDDKDALKRYTDRISEIEHENQAPGRITMSDVILPKTPTVDARPKLILASNGLALMLGLAVLVILMKLRDKIEYAEDLPNGYQPLVVGTVSHAGSAARGLHGRMSRKILGEEMRLLHANLLPPGRSERRIMMITSPTPANGKTSIASQLALSLAKSGLEVLLIDADLRKRDLSTMFDVGFRPGLADLLQGKPPELIRPVELLPNLRLMGAGSKLDRNPVELLQRQQFHESLNLLQEKFDCIVVDTPPALVVADARLIARSCDEVLCVVRAQVSSSKDVNQTIDAITRIMGKAPKIIVNGVAHRQSYYKYKFAYSSNEGDAEVAAAAAGADPLD
jgi:capsular exopolysaccharide synthesis family protein